MTQSPGWYSLLSTDQAARDVKETFLQLGPLSCPNDGQPLTSGPDGSLFCEYDGWKYFGSEKHY